MPRSFRPLSLLLALLLVACSDSVTPLTSPSYSSASVSLETSIRNQLRQSTGRYHQVRHALEDGYVPTACHYSALGGKGYTYRNAALTDGVVDPSAPEILNYEVAANGELRLVGATFIVPASAWDSSHNAPPRLGDQPFLDPRTLGPFGPPPANYSLNVWMWEESPNGLYSTYNSNVGCEFADETVFEILRATTIGRVVYPLGNTALGGQGQLISGLNCIAGPPASHRHAHLSLIVNGEQIEIPAGIGVTPSPVVTAGYVNFSPTKCFYEVHTHDATGTIHLHPNQERLFTLGQFFDVWGQPLDNNNAAGNLGPVVVYVDQQLYQGDIRAIVLDGFKQVNIQVGLQIKPQKYLFPWNP